MQKNVIFTIIFFGVLIALIYIYPAQMGVKVGSGAHETMETKVSKTETPKSTPLEADISGLLSDLYPDDGPGVSALLYKGDEVLYSGGQGLANIEHNIAIGSETVFRIGSITKQFTSAGIMLLNEEGKLEIDDPITKFFPDYPMNGHIITVRHLLTHTSGIKSYTSMENFMDVVKDDMTVEEMIDHFKNEPMDFAPGEKYLYNNSGYFMLGAIIEHLSGQTYEDFIEGRIFTPLGMEASYYGNFNKIIPNRATGYGMDDTGLINSNYMSMSLPYAAGSLISTVGDLMKWNRALFSGAVVAEASLVQMITPFTLNDGEISNYGFGLGIRTFKGQPMITHSGGIPGFITNGAYLPESDMYVTVLGNTGFQSRGYESNKMLALALGDPYPEVTPISVEGSILEKYVGTYASDAGLSFSVSLAGEDLALSMNDGDAANLIAVSNTTFYMKNSFVHFAFTESEAGDAALTFYQDDEGGEGMLANLTKGEE